MAAMAIAMTTDDSLGEKSQSVKKRREGRKEKTQLKLVTDIVIIIAIINIVITVKRNK